MKCKYCKTDIVKFRGEWWHVTTHSETNRKGKLFPEVNLRKLSYVKSHEVTCIHCGKIREEVEYCENPQLGEEE